MRRNQYFQDSYEFERFRFFGITDEFWIGIVTILPLKWIYLECALNSDNYSHFCKQIVYFYCPCVIVTESGIQKAPILIIEASPDGLVRLVTQDKAGINLRCPLHQSRYLHGIKARNELWVKPIVCGLAIILWHLTDLFSQVVIVPISDACRTQERWIETSVTREKWISFTLEAALLPPSDRKPGHPRHQWVYQRTISGIFMTYSTLLGCKYTIHLHADICAAVSSLSD